MLIAFGLSLLTAAALTGCGSKDEAASAPATPGAATVKGPAITAPTAAPTGAAAQAQKEQESVIKQENGDGGASPH